MIDILIIAIFGKIKHPKAYIPSKKEAFYSILSIIPNLPKGLGKLQGFAIKGIPERARNIELKTKSVGDGYLYTHIGNKNKGRGRIEFKFCLPPQGLVSDP